MTTPGGVNLGTAHGTVAINAVPALAALAAMRRSNAATVGALNTTGRAAISLGTGFTAMGALIVAGFAQAVKKSAQLEKKLSYIAGITRVNTAEMQALREKVIQLGQDSAYTANEVADGFTELAKAGATTEQMIGGMGDAMITLGQAADIPLDKAATALVSISSTFRLAASQSTRIANVLSGAANASIISVDDMAVSFKYAGGVAANLGVSLEDTATAIAILGQAGIKGSTAGTSLRRILLQLTPRTEKAAQVMKDLGIITKDGANQFYDAQGKAKKLSDVFQILQDSMKGLNPEQQQKALATIFGDRAINSGIALMRQGAAGFKAMSAELSRSTAAEVAAKRLDNLSGAIEIFKGTVDSALIRSGSDAQKPLQQMVQALTKIVNVFNGLPGPAQKAIVSFFLFIGALSLIAGGILLTIGTILRAVAVLIQLRNAFRILFPLVKQAIWLVRMFTASLLTNPVFLIIAAIIALGVAFYLLWKHSEKFRNAVKAVGAALVTAFKATLGWFKSLPGYAKAAWNAIVGFLSSIFNWVKKNWDILLAILTGPFGLAILVIRRFGDDIVNFFKAIPGKIAGWASGIWDAFMGDAASIPEALGHLIGLIIGKFIRFHYDAAKALWDAGKAMYDAIVGWSNSIKASVLGFFGRMATDAKNFGIRFYHGVIDWFEKLPGRMSSLASSIGTSIKNWAISMATQAALLGVNFYNAVIGWFEKLPGRISSFLQNAWKAAIGWVKNFGSAGRSLGTSIREGVDSFLTSLPGLIRQALTNAINVFKDMIKDAFNAAKDFAKGLWDGFKKGLGINSPSFIEHAMFAIRDEGDNTIGALSKQVRTMQKLGATIPSVMPASAITTPAEITTRAAERASARAAQAIAAPAATTTGGTTIEFKVYNPLPETSSDTGARRLRSLAALGVI
jgi:TP901 family phage tail tape measure protein